MRFEPDRVHGSEPMDGQVRGTDVMEGQGDGYECPPTRWRIDPRGSRAAPALRPRPYSHEPHKPAPNRSNNVAPVDWNMQPKGAYYSRGEKIG